MSSLAHLVFSALVVQFLCLLSLAVSYPDCPVLGLFLWCSILKPSNWWSQFVTLTNVCITSVIYSFMPCPGGRSRAFIASSNATVDRQTGCSLVRTATNRFGVIQAVWSVYVIIWFGFYSDERLYSSISFIFSEMKGKFTKKCDHYS